MVNALDLKNLDILKKEGLQALGDRLGPVGMVNFIRLFSNGYGDYSTERRELVDNISEKDFLDFIS